MRRRTKSAPPRRLARGRLVPLAATGAATLLVAVLAPAGASAGVVPPVVSTQREHWPISAPAGDRPEPAVWRDLSSGEGGAGDTSVRFNESIPPEQPPVVVPLPPALGTGLVGLVGMAVLRVRRRVYRWR